MSGSAVAELARGQAREELFDHRLYRALATRVPSRDNRRLLERLAEQERAHADFWLGLAGTTPDRVRSPRVKHLLLLAARRMLGLVFIIKWLERGEERAIARYRRILDEGLLDDEATAGLRRIIAEEEGHEQNLEDQLADERLAYLGAAVLGLNDALVELTGGLTGLVSSISDTKLIGFSALVVGVAAAGSMAASNFLSVEVGGETELNPAKAAAYTGVAYIFVVAGLVLPFFAIADRRIALAVSWTVALAVIAAFSYYSAVTQEVSFRRRFRLMTTLGLGVAVIAFLIGKVIGGTLGIEA